jgi:Domain of unknown function (DUF4158)
LPKGKPQLTGSASCRTPRTASAVLAVPQLYWQTTAAYERFVGDLSRAELEGYFLLDSTAVDLIANKRGDHNRLGVALQIGTVRYLWHFLTEDPLDVPWSAVEYLAGQLEVADPSVVKRYTERQKTAYEHSWEIRAAYGGCDRNTPESRRRS